MAEEVDFSIGFHEGSNSSMPTACVDLSPEAEHKYAAVSGRNLRLEVQPEEIEKRALPSVGDVNTTGIADPLDPPHRETICGKPGSDSAGQMRPTFAPVNAAPA